MSPYRRGRALVRRFGDGRLRPQPGYWFGSGLTRKPATSSQGILRHLSCRPSRTIGTRDCFWHVPSPRKRKAICSSRLCHLACRLKGIGRSNKEPGLEGSQGRVQCPCSHLSNRGCSLARLAAAHTKRRILGYSTGTLPLNAFGFQRCHY